MAHNKLYRILSLSVALTSLFALTAIADFVGGMGEILGLEAGESYEATDIGMQINTDNIIDFDTGNKSLAILRDKPIPSAPAVTFEDNTLVWMADGAKLVRYSIDPEINGTGEIALGGAKTYTFSPATEAGLWAIYTPANDTYAESAKTIVYVRGAHVDRKQLGEQSDGFVYGEGNLNTSPSISLKEGRLQRSNAFYGYPGGGAVHVPGTYYDTISYSDVNTTRLKAYANAKKAYIADSSETNNQALQKAFDAILYNGSSIGVKEIYYSYVLTQKEIIPISEVVSYKFGLLISKQNYFDYAGNKVKFVAYVADDNGNVGEYVQNHTYDLSGEESVITIDFADRTKWTPTLPKDGYFVRFAVYPYEGIEDPAKLDIASGTSNLQLRYRFYCDDSGYVISEAPAVDVKGISLLLDGTIGAVVNFDYDPAEVKAATLVIEGLSPITATLENGKGKVVVPFYPRLVNTLSYAGSLVCTKTDDSEGTVAIEDISVKYYIEYMQKNSESYAEWIDLIDALEVYCDYAEDYFREGEATLADLSLEAEEAAFVAHNSNRSLDGAMTDVAFHSTSLVLLDTMTIRHYFTIGEAVVLDSIEVDGANLPVEVKAEKDATSRYVYVDVASISADKLDEEQIVTLTLGEETITIKFSAMDYAELTAGDADSKLANLAKAIAKYAYAASQIK